MVVFVSKGHTTVTYTVDGALIFFLTYVLPGELSLLTWSAGSWTTIAILAILTLFSFIYQHLEKGRSVTVGVTRNSEGRKSQTKYFDAVTQTILRQLATETTWPRVQKEHRQMWQFQAPVPTLLQLLYYQCQLILFVWTIPKVRALAWQSWPTCWIFWQCSRKPKIDSTGNSCRWYLCS